MSMHIYTEIRVYGAVHNAMHQHAMTCCVVRLTPPLKTMPT